MDQPTEYVDEYISGSAYTIDANGTIQQAREILSKNNADFLVVTKNNMPIHILKKYQTLAVKPNTLIVDLAREGRLKPAEIVESGAL